MILPAGNGGHGVAFKTIKEERNRVEKALQAAKGNKRTAAKILGIKRDKLYKKMRAMGMPIGLDHWRTRATEAELRYAKANRGLRPLSRKYGVNIETVRKWLNDLDKSR